MAKKPRFAAYVVWKGRTPGVYRSWAACSAEIHGVSGAVYKGFPTVAEAEAAFAGAPPAKASPARAATAAAPAGARTLAIDSHSSAPHLPFLEAGHVVLYSDGGAQGNPGPGGYGVVLLGRDRSGTVQRRELAGGYRRTTNNRMELMGWIVGLETLKQPSTVALFSDSKYVGDAYAQGWAERWRAKGWMRNKTEPAKNADLWARLLPLLETHTVGFGWVKGHAGIPENERCDELAVAAAKGTDLAIDENYESGSMTSAAQ